jgi:hypothetical protein
LRDGKGNAMGNTYEYKFVRLGEYWGSAWFRVRDKAQETYAEVVHEHARNGWRLVQSALARRYEAGRAVDPEVAFPSGQMVTGRGRVRVDRLAADVAWSRKRL